MQGNAVAERGNETEASNQGSSPQAKVNIEWVADVETQLQRQLAYISDENAQRAPTGIWAVDEAMDGGIRGGEVFGLMARSGVGKTIALCNIAYTWGIRCSDRLHVMFSLEMPTQQISLRLSQIACGMDKVTLRDSLKDNVFDNDTYRKSYPNLLIVDKPGPSVDDMSALISLLQVATGMRVGMVTIDYLGLIGGNKNMTSRYERVSENAVALKNLAKQFNAAVIVAVQVNREKGGDGTRRVDLSSSRDSGVIEEAVDYMAGLWRKDAKQSDLVLALLKNRHGPQMEVVLHFDRTTLAIADRV